MVSQSQRGMTQHLLTLLLYSILMLVTTTSIQSDIIYEINTFREAQHRLDKALIKAPELINSKSCLKILKKELNYTPDKELIVPFFLIDELFYGYNPNANMVDIMEWDQDDIANNVCVRLRSGVRLNYINIDMNSVLLLTSNQLVDVVLHETVHAIQCASGKTLSDSNEEMSMDQIASMLHLQVAKVMNVCREVNAG